MNAWRLLLDGEGGPAANMAVDEALLRLVENPVLRVYQWDRPAVSIGYFQSREVVPAGREFVRRYTGGGLVDHAADVTYTVVLPRVHPLARASTADCYCAFHRVVQQALSESGLAATLAESSAECEAAGCFEKPVKFDVLQGGQKLAGAAQRRTREGMLQQGSVLLPDPAGNPRFREMLPGVFARRMGIEFAASGLTEAERALADELARTRYGNRDWNESR